MKLEQLRVPLIPRSNIDCIDLGIMFFGRHFVSMLRLWCWVAIPTMLIVYVGAWYETLDLGYVLLLLFFVTGVWSPLLVAKTSRAVFGESFDRYPSRGRELMELTGLTFKALGARLLTLLGFCLLVIPGWLIGVRSSFFPEKQFLSSMEGRSQDRRTSELINQEIGQLIQRSLSIVLMSLCVVICLFATVDFFSNLLFQKPILLGRFSFEDFFTYFGESDLTKYIFYLLIHDPLVLAVLSGVILFVYPIARFAWFFSYIDLRVRGDFWDLELRFQKEVERLQESRA